MLEPLFQGIQLFFTMDAVFAVLVGTLLGLLIGVLPGLGPLMGIILLLPITFHMEPVAGMGLLIAIYVGGSCGGAISAILVRIPGTPLAAATLLDGYPMAQKGRAKDAVGIAISASALGGVLGGIVLIFLAPLLARFALEFAPPETFALALTGLLVIALVSNEATSKGIMTGAFGLLISTIGYDQFANDLRFTFGVNGLLGGIHIVAMVVGLFAISEVIVQIKAGFFSRNPDVPWVRPSLNSALMVLSRWVNLVRSSAIGSFLGALPGAGGVVSSFTAYAIARSSSKTPEKFGTGFEDGIVATESANNATVGGSLIPTLSLGIPGDATSAVLMGALIILGFFPGPNLFEQNQDVVGGIFLAYMSANVVLFFAGIFLTPLFVACIKFKKQYLLPFITLLCVLGVFSLESSTFHLWVMLAFGIIGYVLRRHDYPLAPMVIGMVLGPIAESNFRRSLVISGNDYSFFIDRPIAATILAINLVLIIWMLCPKGWKNRLLRRA